LFTHEADKNLPSEAAKLLLPVVPETSGGLTGISPSQVTQLLKHLGIDSDGHHCVLENKFRRKFVTRAGIDAIANFIRPSPRTQAPPRLWLPRQYHHRLYDGFSLDVTFDPDCETDTFTIAMR
jgi:hypothetical protein